MATLILRFGSKVTRGSELQGFVEVCLRCPLKSPDFLNVSKASSVTTIWKPLGQGSSLVPLRTTCDTWLPPSPPYTYLRCPLKSADFLNVSKASSVTPIWKPLGQGSSLVFHVSCVMWHMSCFRCHVSCVMCHWSPVTCHLTTTLCSFSRCRRFHD